MAVLSRNAIDGAAETRRRRVLLVDDSATVRSLVRVFLMGQSLEFVDASDGRHALEVVARERVDVAIVDINMPQMNGLDFLRAIRKDRLLRSLPVIVLSADKTSTLKRDAIGAGANEVLQKPVSGAYLTQAIERVLGPVPR